MNCGKNLPPAPYRLCWRCTDHNRLPAHLLFEGLYAGLQWSRLLYKSPVVSSARLTPAYWELATRHGAPVDVVNWWVTWPAEPVLGHIISERAYYFRFSAQGSVRETSRLTYPEELYTDVESLVMRPDEVTFADARPYMDVSAEEFAAKLDLKDRISLIKFDDRIQLLQEWTQSRFQLHRALNRVEPGMFTRLYDALLLAARDQFGNTQSRRAIILLSDGVDSGRGATTAEQALQAVLNAQVSVYVVSNGEISRAAKRAQLDALLNSDAVTFNQLRIEDLREGLRALDDSEVKLAKLTEATGGRLYKPVSFDRLDDAYREVADELRRQYALYYRPTNKARDGSFRRVHVETRNPQYRTTTRVGYYAPRG